MTSPASYTSTWRQIGGILSHTAALRDELRAVVGSAATADLDRRIDETQRKWAEQTFRISVLALTKSGKSSLLNSWLGDEFLPMSSAPETARMVRIRHSPSRPSGRLLQDDVVVAEGALAICAWLKTANEAVRTGTKGGTDLVLEASLCALREHELGEQRFEIVDTPGPNEAGVDQLRARVETMIEKSDVVVYLLDYTKLKTEEEQTLFVRLRQMRPELLQDCADRMFFVLNKVDLVDRNALTPDAAREYVVGVLRQQFKHLLLTADRILPSSASHALLARLVLHGLASAAVREDFAKIRFGWDRPADEALYAAAAPQLLERSGVPEIEARILKHIFATRSHLLLSSLAGEIQRCIELEDGLFAAAHRSASMDLGSLSGALAAIRRDLQQTGEELDRLSAVADGHAKRIETFVNAEMGAFRTAIRDRIQGAFELNATHERRAPRSWFGLGLAFAREQIGFLLGAPQQSPTDLAARAQAIDAALAGEVEEAFADFRERLETQVQTHQRALHDELVHLVDPIVRRAEQKVGRALSIDIPPVRVHVAVPTAEETHWHVEQRIARIVASHTQVETHATNQRVLVRRGGFCSPDVYRDRPVYHQTVHTDVDAVVAELKSVWNQRIDDMTQVSLATAHHVIRAEVGEGIRRVRTGVEQYVASYTTVVAEEERRKQSDASSQNERERALSAMIARLTAVQLELDAVRAFLPGAPARLTSPHPALAQLLADVFDERELRNWVSALPQGEEVRRNLPGEGTPLATLAAAAADKLLSRGLAGSDLFRSVESARPYRGREVRRAERVCAAAARP